jgi:hypothetical protein
VQAGITITLSDADVVLVAIQTDKDGFAPDYGLCLAD